MEKINVNLGSAISPASCPYIKIYILHFSCLYNSDNERTYIVSIALLVNIRKDLRTLPDTVVIIICVLFHSLLPVKIED